MATKSRPKPPSRTKSELRSAILETARRKFSSGALFKVDDAIMFLTEYFTAIDLEAILVDMEKLDDDPKNGDYPVSGSQQV